MNETTITESEEENILKTYKNLSENLTESLMNIEKLNSAIEHLNSDKSYMTFEDSENGFFEGSLLNQLKPNLIKILTELKSNYINNLKRFC